MMEQVLAQPQTRRQQKRERSIWHYLGLAASVVLLIAIVAVVALAAIVPRAAGGTALTVLTQSMEPTLPPGTLIIVRPQPVDTIRIGEVVTYQIESGKPAVISHRVISRTVSDSGEVSLVTKGDNNALADPVVTAPQVKGVLWYSIPYLGFLNNFIGNQSWLVPVAAGALFVYAAYMIVTAAISGRRARRAGLDTRTP